MTATRSSPSLPDPEPIRLADELSSAEQSALESGPQWPLTLLAGLGLTALLWLCEALPIGLMGHSEFDWAALLLPAALATTAARLLFEVVHPSGHGRGVARHLIPALLTAVAGTGICTVAAVIIGIRWTPGAVVTSSTLSMGVLVGAGVARDLEIRVRLALRRVYIIGGAATRADLERELRRRREASFVGGTNVARGLDSEQLVDTVLASRATVLVLDAEALRDPVVIEAASRLNLAGVYVRDLVTYYESQFKKVSLSELTPTWFLFDMLPTHRRLGRDLVRRAAELIVALLLMILGLPLLTAALVGIRLTSPGPLFYRQRRVGRGGSAITLLKLRTMTVEGETAAWATAQVHRITPIGRQLRRFRLDEVPQLINVIRGDLALIGPRPEQIPIVERLEQEIPFYGARHRIRPGLTGWAQVNMGYGGSMDGTLVKLQRDLFYVKHAGLRLDALILWMTVQTVISGRG